MRPVESRLQSCKPCHKSAASTGGKEWVKPFGLRLDEPTTRVVNDSRRRDRLHVCLYDAPCLCVWRGGKATISFI